MEIENTDSHIPSTSTAAKLFGKPKQRSLPKHDRSQPFRLILRLEKTAVCSCGSAQPRIRSSSSILFVPR